MLRKYLFAFYCLFSLSAAADDNKTLLVLGDSLSAGYGIAIERSWVFQLQHRLMRQGYRYKVVNASISGDTTRGARARLIPLLEEVRPLITIVELGGNDGLRGLALEEMQTNLTVIIEHLLGVDSHILLIPMKLPPNYGDAYIRKFEMIYMQLADQYDIKMVPFILEGIAGDDRLMQDDGIHPAASAQKKMLNNLWPDLLPLLE
ncbi:MAG: arylesterase [Gammaproteobacteria bacterium]